MSDPEPFPPARGDESELFREFDPRLVAYISDIVNAYELRTDVDDALSLLAELPRRPREVALLRAFGLSHPEIADVAGASERRVQKLITQANHLIDLRFARPSSAAGWRRGVIGDEPRWRSTTIDPPSARSSSS